jgi:hypothetical protein
MSKQIKDASTFAVLRGRTLARALLVEIHRIPDEPGSEVLGSVRIGLGETELEVTDDRAELA